MRFYSGRKIEGIYAYFRAGADLTGKIMKPTGEQNENICISG